MKSFGKVITQKKLVFPGQFAYLEKIRNLISQMSKSAGFDDDNSYRIELAVDEACTNIIEHAYRGETDRTIECLCVETEKALLIQLKDVGTSFNPDLIPKPLLNSNLFERKPGGLGLHFIRKFIDEVQYKDSSLLVNDQKRSPDGNYLLLVKYKEGIK
jgi:serine/threonine-protein kinase RsbW